MAGLSLLGLGAVAPAVGQAREVPLARTLHARPAQPHASGLGLLSQRHVLVPRVPHPHAYAARKAAVDHAYFARRSRQASGGKTASSPMAAGAGTTSAAAGPATLTPAPPTALFEELNEPGIASNGMVTPPDTTGAIGPSDYVEFVNSQIAVFDRTTLASPPLATAGEDEFTGGLFPCDGQIRWDQAWQRWEYVVLECKGTGAERFFFGWSKTADPTNLASGWCKYEVDTGSVLEDYPKLGGDDNFLIVGANGFELSPEEKYVGSSVFAIPKPAVGEPICPAQSSFGSGSSLAVTEFKLPAGVQTPVPANVFGSSSTGYVVAAEYPESEPSAETLHLLELTGSGTNPALSESDVTVGRYFIPPNVPQPNTTDGLDSMDTRLTQAVAVEDPALHGMAIWTQHTVSTTEGAPSVIRWYELEPGVSTPTQEGTVKGAGGSFAFNGAISSTSAGDGAAIDYNVGGQTQLVGLRARSRAAATPPGTMTGELTLAESQAVDGDFSCPSVTEEPWPCRWGDYAAASPDPSQPVIVWGSGQVNGPTRSGHAAQWATENFALATDSPPAPSFTVTTASPTAASPVSFDGSASSDPDGTIESYEWSFGDGSPAQGGATPSHTYAAAGTYTVTLKVTDNAGLSASVQHTITVADVPPSAAFSVGGGSPTAASPVSFDGSASSDPDGTIESYEWDFGDGSTAAGGATPSHTYAAPGVYTITLKVTDNAGLSASVQHMITVADAPPSASFAVTTAAPTAASPVSFDGSASSDPDGTIAAYNWTFGDGASAAGAQPTHAYAQAGTYTVSLTVTDNAGLSASVQHTIAVAEPSNTVRVTRVGHRRDGSVILTVLVSNRGVLRAQQQPVKLTSARRRRGALIQSARVTASQAGSVRLTLAPTAAGRAVLRHKRRLYINVLIKFAPSGGTPRALKRRLVLRTHAGKHIAASRELFHAGLV